MTGIRRVSTPISPLFPNTQLPLEGCHACSVSHACLPGFHCDQISLDYGFHENFELPHPT